MPRLDISHLCPGEKPPDRRPRRVRDVGASRTADEQRGAVISYLMVLVREREIGHVVERGAEDGQRDAEFENVVVRRAD